tara:strand:+ start:25768 stop:27174 length:1407 start_codon:yes stop_codon:yes gene_type:complete
MAAFSNVNADGVPLNVSQAVQDDTDASNFASHLRGQLTPAQKRDREYHTPAESLSTINDQVHKLYDALLDIKNNPENYTEEQINKALDNQDLLDRLNENYFSGNYQAKLGNREGAAYKYWRMYRSNKKNWDKRRDAMVANEKKKLDDKGMKITDEMTPKQRREMRNKRQEALSKVRNKYNRGDLGQQINYLIGKVNEILLEEPPRYKEDERFAAAAYVPRQRTARQAKAAAAIRGLPNLRALRERRAKREQKRFAEGYTKSSPAKASSKPKAEFAAAVAKPTAKPSVKVMYGDRWIGPYTSRTTSKKYWTRERDRLSVYVSSNGELTEGKILATEEAKAKKAAKKGGRRKTRKMKGGHHLYKRLGVSKYASQKQIKKAYNKLKKKKKLTQKVKYAYKILSKKKSRKKYNAKYKKHKKHKNTKKRKKRKGGLPSVTVKAQIWPENYRPDVNVVNSNQPNVRTWTASLAN